MAIVTTRRVRRGRRTLAFVASAALLVAGCAANPSAGESPVRAATTGASTAVSATSDVTSVDKVAATAASTISSPAPAAAPPTTLPTTTVPAPVVNYAFPVGGGVRADYSRAHHDYPATDIFAACGSQLLSPVDGVVVHVRRVSQYNPKIANPATLGGLSVAVLGLDGIRYYQSHLNAVSDGIEVGLKVNAGDQLGIVGNTGDAVTCHIHFGISVPCDGLEWAVRRGVGVAVAVPRQMEVGRNGQPDTRDVRMVARQCRCLCRRNENANCQGCRLVATGDPRNTQSERRCQNCSGPLVATNCAEYGDLETSQQTHASRNSAPTGFPFSLPTSISQNTSTPSAVVHVPVATVTTGTSRTRRNAIVSSIAALTLLAVVAVVIVRRSRAEPGLAQTTAASAATTTSSPIVTSTTLSPATTATTVVAISAPTPAPPAPVVIRDLPSSGIVAKASSALAAQAGCGGVCSYDAAKVLDGDLATARLVRESRRFRQRAVDRRHVRQAVLVQRHHNRPGVAAERHQLLVPKQCAAGGGVGGNRVRESDDASFGRCADRSNVCDQRQWPKNQTHHRGCTTWPELRQFPRSIGHPHFGRDVQRGRMSHHHDTRSIRELVFRQSERRPK